MATASVSVPRAELSFGYYANLFRNEVRYEFLRMLRLRSYSLSVIGFPVMFYLLFGTLNSHNQYARYLLASYSCFGLVGAALFGLGAGIAMERAQGWLDLKMASPMPRFAYLFAKTMSAAGFALVVTCLLSLIGVTLAGVHMTGLEFAKLIGITLAGAIPFASMGLLVSLLVPPTAGPGIINLIYLPMSFASGLWMPLDVLPKWMQHVAPALPAYHFAQIALHIFGFARSGSSLSGHWEALLGFTCLMLGAAWLVFSRREAKA
ncbi:ABC transporter permease [Silvibacterium dinghuense]|nr:ABC transporter permease [Silvibacterium dinghuense]GGG91631.1 ABC transporter [Silvibacterium dinghuense]